MAADKSVWAKTIADLNLSPYVRNILVGTVYYHLPEAKREADPIPKGAKAEVAWYRHKAASYTIRRVATILGDDYFTVKKTRGVRALLRKLRELGLSGSDWPPLAASYKEACWAMFDVPGNGWVCRKRRRAISVAYLGMSNKAAVMLQFHFQRPLYQITVADLLTTPVENWSTLRGYNRRWEEFEKTGIKIEFKTSYDDYHGVSVKQSIASARQRLRELGFTHKDGIFLYEFTYLWHIEQVMKEFKIGRKAAELFWRRWQRANELNWATQSLP